MKVIFLDHDGVVCLMNNWGSRYKKQRKVYTKNNSIPMQNELPVELRFDDFDKKSIKVLNNILEESGSEIVVSSDWRYHATLDELGDYFESQGIIKRPISVTDRCGDISWVGKGVIPPDFPWTRDEHLEQQRHFEIKKWLGEHPEVTHWVAIDDLNMGKTSKDYRGEIERKWGLDNFVLTPRRTEGIKQSGIKEKILNFLK